MRRTLTLNRCLTESRKDLARRISSLTQETCIQSRLTLKVIMRVVLMRADRNRMQGHRPVSSPTVLFGIRRSPLKLGGNLGCAPYGLSLMAEANRVSLPWETGIF